MKILFLSDSHGNNRSNKIPKDIDTIVHTGDFTDSIDNAENSFLSFIEWLSEQTHVKNKIFIAGNHDKLLYKSKDRANSIMNHFNNPKKDSNMKPANIIYLEDSEVIIDGIKFYGSPWTPVFYNWYFMKNENRLADYFDLIPNDTDILLTHGPAEHILDRTNRNLNVGSSALRYKIEKLPDLQVHAFGHIHEDRGMIKKGNTIFINASQAYKQESFILEVFPREKGIEVK